MQMFFRKYLKRFVNIWQKVRLTFAKISAENQRPLVFVYDKGWISRAHLQRAERAAAGGAGPRDLSGRDGVPRAGLARGLAGLYRSRRELSNAYFLA